MSKCSVQGCNITADFLLSHIDDGNTRKVFCPNHVLMYFLKMVREEEVDMYLSQLSAGTDLHCEICGNEGVQFKEFKYAVKLCDKHLEKLIKRNLAPEEFFVLYKKYPDMYLIHDDFYDPATGIAFQPVEE